ncbi:MAG: hypothetical protein KC983_11185 [Phycisphaerales bacterium]|nr:hypothetical protein [Phycisphaerales bacterium]
MTTPDSNRTSTWTRWNTAASVLLSVVVLAGMHRIGSSMTSDDAFTVAGTSELTTAPEHTANIIDDIEDILEDLLDILDGNDPKEPAGGD